MSHKEELRSPIHFISLDFLVRTLFPWAVAQCFHGSEFTVLRPWDLQDRTGNHIRWIRCPTSWPLSEFLMRFMSILTNLAIDRSPTISVFSDMRRGLVLSCFGRWPSKTKQQHNKSKMTSKKITTGGKVLMRSGSSKKTKATYSTTIICWTKQGIRNVKSFMCVDQRLWYASNQIIKYVTRGRHRAPLENSWCIYDSSTLCLKSIAREPKM